MTSPFLSDREPRSGAQDEGAHGATGGAQVRGLGATGVPPRLWITFMARAIMEPLLPDPKDDMLLELAVAARCQSIITYNVRDFVGAEKFGISVLEPGPFLSGVGVLE